MNILYGILATSKQKKRIDAVISGWVKDIKSPHRHIIIGDSGLCDQLPRVWNCISSEQDSYKTLVNKMVNCYRQLLDDLTWDFFVKVDDDTFVVHERIEALLKEFDSLADLYMCQRQPETLKSQPV